MVSIASTNGFGTPSFWAFLSNSCLTFVEIVKGINIFWSIAPTSLLDNLPKELAYPSSDIPSNLDASISPFKFFLTLNNARLAFKYASTTSLGSIGPPFNDTLVNNPLESLTPFW